MPRNSLGLGFLFTARDLASASVNRLGRNFEKFQKRADRAMTRTQRGLTQLGVGIAAATVGAAGLAGSFALAGRAGEFTQELARVAAISDVATDSLEATRQRAAALDAGLRTQFSPKEAAEGLRQFASQGFTVEQQTQSLTPALRLAQAGMIGISDASSAMTSALKVFKLEASDAALTTDKLLKITTKTSLQAEDLTLALGTVGRGAGIAKQNLDEMLIAMGLVKNTGVDTSVAASSVSSALTFMAKNAESFQKDLGVSVTDASGKFRNFVDVVLETSEALDSKYTNEATKAAIITKKFGRFGTTAFQAVASQVQSGVRTATGQILKGRQAVEFLRGSLQDAAGTAEEFEKKLLNTFAGQKRILQGVVQTLAIALGTPFERAFKPVIEVIRDVVKTMVDTINAIPDDVKNVFAQVAVGVSALVASFGAFIALKGGITVLASAMSFLGITAGTILGPLTLVAGLATAASLAFVAMERNAASAGGGLLGTLGRGVQKIKLFFRGLFEFIREGRISGALKDELLKAENEGVLRFLGKVVAFGKRMDQLFRGIGGGFRLLIDNSQPVFDELSKAFKGLSDSMGFYTADLEGAAGTPSQRFLAMGFKIGAMIAQVSLLVIRALTLVIKTITIVQNTLDSLGLDIGTIIKLWLGWKAVLLARGAFGAAVGGVNLLRGGLFKLGAMTRLARIKFSLLKRGLRGVTLAMNIFSGGAVASSIGRMAAMGTAAKGLAIGGVAKLAAGVKGLLVLLAGPAGLVVAAGAAGVAFGKLANMLGAADFVADKLAELTGQAEEQRRLEAKFGGRTNVRRGAPAFLSAPEGRGNGARAIPRAPARPTTQQSSLAVAAGAAPIDTGDARGNADLLAEFERQTKEIEKLGGTLTKQGQKQQVVVVQLDGETIATAVNQVQRSSDADNFKPTGSED